MSAPRVDKSEYAAHIAHVLHMRFHALLDNKRRAEVYHIGHALAKHLATLDPEFDRDKFLKNCGFLFSVETSPDEGNNVEAGE